MKGKIAGQKTPFTEKQVEMIEAMLTEDTRLLAIRDYALFRTAVSTMLRASDVLKIELGDVWYRGEVVDEFSLMQTKTRRPIKCLLLPKAKDALRRWILVSGIEEPDARVFAITIRQYSRIVKSMAEMLRLNPAKYSTHSLRRTRPSIIYAKTKNIAAVRKLLGHAGIQATSEYLGVDQEEAFRVSREFDI
jgi:integrase